MQQEPSDKIKTELANAMNIEPADIMEYRQTVDGKYNVILWSYQKFVQVEPKEVSPVPEEFRKSYQRPELSSKSQLLKLCEILGIDPGDKPLKKELVKEINHYRLNN